MKTLDDMLVEIEEAVTSAGLERSDRLARLGDIRSELAEALDDVDERMAAIEAEDETPQIDVTLGISKLRESADVRDQLIEAETATASELDDDGVLSHAELDALAEEGLLDDTVRHLVTTGKLLLTDGDED